MASPRSLLIGVKEKLKSLVWPGTANKIFGENVFIVTVIPIENIGLYSIPCAFVIDNGSIPHPMHNVLHEQEFLITFFVQNVGHRHGESVVISGNRTPDTSQGVGYLEVEEVIIDSLELVKDVSGEKIVLNERSKPKAIEAKGNKPSVFRTIIYRALVTLDISSPQSPSVENVLRSPGFAYWNPVNIAGGDFGDLLGFLVNGLQVEADVKIKHLRDESRGRYRQKSFFCGSACSIIASFFSYENKVLEVCFPQMVTDEQVRINLKSGTEIVSGRGQFLFVPDDIDNNYIVTITDCTPHTVERFRINRRENTFFPVVFDSLDSGSVLYIGPRDDF